MVEPTALTLSILTLVGVALNGLIMIFKKSSCTSGCMSCNTGATEHEDIILETVNADDSTTKITIPANLDN